MKDKQMKKKIDALDFAQLELQLYLDINPDDEAARAYYSDVSAKLYEAEREYYSASGKIWPMQQNYHGGMREWVTDPWPWEYQY